MASKQIERMKENPLMYGTIAAMIAILGGSVAVELPADRALKAVRLEMAQNYDMREKQYEQQQAYHKEQEKRDIRFRMKYLSNEINRMNELPQYLNRPLNAQEAWTIQQYKKEWNTLQEALEKKEQ